MVYVLLIPVILPQQVLREALDCRALCVRVGDGQPVAWCAARGPE